MFRMFGIPFEVIPSGMTEFFAEGEREWRALDMARKKAFMVQYRNKGRWVLAADTMVQIGKDYLGKPKDEADAARMLKRLSGWHHHVYTGVCLRAPDGTEFYDAEVTRVAMLTLPDVLIQRYIATGEPMDKAGAYAIQGMGGIFVTRIEGSASNVAGLPLSAVARIFRQAGFGLPPLRMPGSPDPEYIPPPAPKADQEND